MASGRVDAQRNPQTLQALHSRGGFTFPYPFRRPKLSKPFVTWNSPPSRLFHVPTNIQDFISQGKFEEIIVIGIHPF